MAPVIKSVDPRHGPATGGTIITGTGFTGATSVKFGAVPVASFTVVTDSQITTTAPPGGTAMVVTVTTPRGTGNGIFSIDATLPVITGLSPSSGPAGTLATISGSGFTGATSVTFGATLALFRTASDTQITAEAPAGSGTALVRVTTSAGTSNSASFVYVSPPPAPVISNLSPQQGPTRGGNVTTIVGTNLASATSAKFGSHPATIVSKGATWVSVMVPAGAAAPVDVTVVTPGGTSAPLPYFYVAPPSVTGLDPTIGPSAGGNTVTIFGANLALASAVRFGSHTATNVDVVSDRQITANAPAGTGSVLTTVTTPGGTSTTGLGNAYYTFVAPPVISALSPGQGSAEGGEDILITGNDLTYTDEVRFGGVSASFTAISNTQVVAATPPGSPGAVTVRIHTPGGTSNGLDFQYEGLGLQHRVSTGS